MIVAPKIGVTIISGVMLDILDDATQILESLFLPLLILELVVLGRLRELGWDRVKEMLANGGTTLLFIPASFVGALVWTAVFEQVGAWVPWTIPNTGWTLLAAIVLADFIYYWEHRFEHETRLPWDLYHSVHHSSSQYDPSTSLRLGIFDGLISPVYYLPMLLLGFSPELTFGAVAFMVAYQTWLHTEVITRMPTWFEAVFNTPSHHRAHHGAVKPYLDVNYGGILIIWDRLFGTFQAELERPVYGLTTPLGSSKLLDIQFASLRGLLRDLLADRSWRVRWARLWNAPNWEPSLSARAQPRP